jgi:putative sterol carrier protein
MKDATDEFFERLSARGHEPLVQDATATVRFDIARGRQVDRWCLRIDKGDLQVSAADADADAAIGADRALFNRIATGEVNVFAALLRGELLVTGDPELFVLVQRLFPGPPQARDRQVARDRQAVPAEGGRSG